MRPSHSSFSMRLGDLTAAFEESGYVAPVPLFDERECRAILAGLLGERTVPPLDWAKGRAATSPAYYELATDDRLLDLVTELIGEDVLLWGATLLARRPGQVHHWHTDIESASATGKTVSVWIGLAETNPGSSLKVVPFSHEFGATIQQVMQENGSDGARVTDGDVDRWAKERDPRSGVTNADTFDGDALVFDGRLWHASNNLNERGTRHAVLLQYATPATPIRIPDLRPGWPIEIYRTPRPPCIVVSGHDAHAVNRVVPGPVPSGDGLPVLSSRIHALSLPLERDLERGWRPRGLFRGTTRAVESIGAHASVLEPGRVPHPPHRHEDEELLLVLVGEAELLIEDPEDREQLREHRLGRGSFAYYPANVSHTIRNASASPVTYVIFKWTTDRGGTETLGPRVLASPVTPDGPIESSGRSTIGLLEGETTHLRQLGSHVTTLEPGAGYEPHVDSYDVAIVTLDGTVETLGERVERNSVIFYAAGEPHGMRNVGNGAATYVVFEFRGSHPNAHLERNGSRQRPAAIASRVTALRERASSAMTRMKRALR